jgi:hypothetical protein
MSILETSHRTSMFQGEFFCMGEAKAKKPGSRPSLSFVFVHTHVEREQAPMFLQSEAWWLRCRRWIEYHSIQWRWDIERRLARHFNRRWGG